MAPVTIAGFGINAGIYQAVDYPSYGQGAAAYAQRLGATLPAAKDHVRRCRAGVSAASGPALHLRGHRHNEIPP